MLALPPILPDAPTAYSATNEAAFRTALTRYFQQQRTDSAVTDPSQGPSTLNGTLVKSIGGGVLGNTRVTEVGTLLTVGDALTVTGATLLESTLGVAGATALAGALSVTGAATLSSTLGVTGDTTIQGVLNVEDTHGVGSTFLGALDVEGATVLASTLTVLDAALLSWNVEIDGVLTLQGNVGIHPALTGAFNVPNTATFKWRNAANSADLTGIYYDSSNNLWLGDNNAASIQLLGGSGGVAVQISTGGGTKWFFQGTGSYDLMPWNNFPGNDNLQSIGSSTTRLKSVFAGTSVISPLLDSQSGDLVLKRAGVAAATFGASAVTINQPITSGQWQATAIDATHGGTNQTTWTTGDLLYSSAANTLAKLAGNITTAKQYLSQTGSGAASAAPSWAQPAFADLSGTIANAQVSGHYTGVTQLTIGQYDPTGDGNVIQSAGNVAVRVIGGNGGYTAGRANGSFGALTPTNSGDILGFYDMLGYDGSVWLAGSSFRGLATEAWTPTAHGSKFQLLTVKAGTTVLKAYLEMTDTTFYPVTASTKLFDQGIRSTNIYRNVYAMRYYAQGTALATTDFAVSAGWGTSPTKAVTGTDMGGRISITAKATTSANPTLTLTFHDGTFTNIPAIAYCGGDTTGPAVGAWLMTTVSATAPVFTWIGTPTANHVYVFDWAVVPS